ncbi:hypothetical protein UT300018_12250 [Clostridium faecium]|uniref:hypothetical protein n=1 Tax=Clostridium TaxID=1485 RepID=UPI001FACD6D5|nr:MULTISPECIES: hypothetical protein [Clostridium]
MKYKNALPNIEIIGISNSQNENTALPGKTIFIASNIGLFKPAMPIHNKNPLRMTNTLILIAVDFFLTLDEIKIVNEQNVSVPISPTTIIFSLHHLNYKVE